MGLHRSGVFDRSGKKALCEKLVVVAQRFEASLALSEYQMFEAYEHGDVMRRIGINRFWPNFPIGIYKTKKGWIGVTTITPAQWRAFCDMLGLSELRDDPALVMGADRLQHVQRIERLFIPRLKARTAREWFAEGLKRKIPIVPVPQIPDLLQDLEKRERGAIVPVLLGEEGPNGRLDAEADTDAAAPGRQGSSSGRAAERKTCEQARHWRYVVIVRPRRCRRATIRGDSRHRLLDGLGGSVVFAHTG